MSEVQYMPLPPLEKPRFKNLVIAGWIFTFLMPIVGFIIGIILTAKGRGGHGVAQIVLSILVVYLTLSWAFDSYSSCIDQAHTLRQINQCSN